MNRTKKNYVKITIIIALFLGAAILPNSSGNQIMNAQHNETNQQSSQIPDQFTIISSFEEEFIIDEEGDYHSPDGWDIDGICISHQEDFPHRMHYFTQMIDSDENDLVHSGNSSVVVWWSDGNLESNLINTKQDEWLISPPIDITNLYDFTLNFWSVYSPTQTVSMPFHYKYKVNNSYSIKVSTDHGITWREVADLRNSKYELGVDLTSPFDYNNDYGDGDYFDTSWWRWVTPKGDFFNLYDEPVEVSFDIGSEDRAHSDTLLIAWHYKYGGEGPHALWALDDINISASYDENKPRISFEKPETNSLYLTNTFLTELTAKTIIIGSIDVELDVKDYETGVKSVQIYVDNRLKETIQSKPYIWHWDDFSIGPHTLTVKSTDFSGNIETKEIRVIKIL